VIIPRPLIELDRRMIDQSEALPKNLFETVCAFLNLDGGLIVLGVADDGTVTWLQP